MNGCYELRYLCGMGLNGTKSGANLEAKRVTVGRHQLL